MSNPFKFQEDQIVDQLKDYIASTYSQHYSEGDGGLQLVEWFHATDDAIPFCRTGIQKYVSRFGKKDGFNEKDLMKAAHLLVWLIYFSRQKATPK